MAYPVSRTGEPCGPSLSSLASFFVSRTVRDGLQVLPSCLRASGQMFR
jgi:hypothetical protein